MYKSEQGICFSPTDLTVFFDSEFAAWMERWYYEQRNGPAGANGDGDGARRSFVGPNAALKECSPDEADAELELIARKGDEHEAAILQTLKQQFSNVVEIDRKDLAAFQNTISAMKAAVPLIYQACLEQTGWRGFADFLLRLDGQSELGNHHYEVWDTKLARSPKPYFLVQLCAYADFLLRVQGVLPSEVEVILGNRERRRFRTKDFFYYYLQLKRAFVQFQESFDAAMMPHPGLSSSFGRWNTYAEQVLAQADHLSCIARATRSQIRKLETAGINTMTALSSTAETYISGITSEVLGRLKLQAQLQIQSRGRDKPLYRVVPAIADDPHRGLALLPPASANDVFFDMEGYPLIEGGLEYLLGAVYVENDNLIFIDWWAHNAIEEKKAFEDFVDWAFARWSADRSMHIYHYAAYEVMALRRLMGQYASREHEVDELLRNQVFVDLYTVVRQGILIGTPTYSLKDVERVYLPKREGGVTTAGGSIVAYQRWLDDQDGMTWKESKTLCEIRDYNCVDCESLWHLSNWLRQLQKDSGIGYLAEPKVEEVEKKSASDDEKENSAKKLAERLLAEVAGGHVVDIARRRVQELLAWILEFHWREAKPVFWRMFDRHEMTEAELIDDMDCLGGLRRTAKTKQQEKRSWLYEYQFDPDQDTKLHEGSSCIFAHDLDSSTQIFSFDAERGLLSIKLGPNAAAPPNQLNLIPDEYVSAKAIADAVYRYVEAWAGGTIISPAVDDLLHRRLPRVRGHAGGPLVPQTDDPLPTIVSVGTRMDGTTLCIQGPPGTGKTFTAAAIIAQLLKDGKRVAVTATSHKCILNILGAIVEARKNGGAHAAIIKVGDHCDDPLVRSGQIQHVGGGGDAAKCLTKGPLVMGGTAWVFCRPELEGQFDYLFIDEAGQFSLANVVATGLAARNIVLVGDQMQLAQPIQGSHPGESGLSALQYLLQEHATIPPELGIFLGTTRRMHPDICRFISEAVYENRLTSHPDNSRQAVLCGDQRTARVTKQSGVVFVPVMHESNTQCSDEEVEAIHEIVQQLLGRCVVEKDDSRRDLTLNDILIVAPYNMQVRRLQKRLGLGARVGSVDKFQGQEAPVVVVSMCASSADDCPRGIDFLLNKNRINVAISRAKCLAIVVGCPALMTTRCRSIEQMQMTNLYCWLADFADSTSN